MNKKIAALLALFTLAFLTSSLCGFAFAAESEQTVYVKNNGTGNGSTADQPLGSLTAAVNALGGKGGHIVVCGPLSIGTKTTLPEQSGDLTITAENGGMLNLSNRLQFEKNRNNNVITLDLPLEVTASYECYMFGGFNSLVFGKNFTVTSKGGGAFSFYGGVHCGEISGNADCITELPYSVTVYNGVFNRFTAGSLRSSGTQPIGSIAAPVSVAIHDGIFGKIGTYNTETNNKSFDPFSVSGMSLLASDAHLTISGGTFHTPIYIQGRTGIIPAGGSQASSITASDEKYYALDGDITLEITGGKFNGKEISAYYTCAAYTQVMRGNFDVTIGAGASFAAGTVVDATQVKAREGSEARASITYPASSKLTIKRFDLVNGSAKRYEEPLRVVFIGDSITEGYPSDRLTQSYPAQFLQICEKAGKEVLVANYGVSASGILPTTTRYYPDMLAYPLALYETDADIVLFALGTNDANVAGGTIGALEKFYTDYKAFVEEMGRLPDTKRVYVTSVLYRKTSNAPADIRAVSVIRPLQERIADELNAAESGKYAFLDFYALTLPYLFDGTLFSTEYLHPNVSGYAHMGQIVYDALFDGVTEDEKFEMTDIYVSSGGKLNGEGTEKNPMSSLTIALAKAAPEAVIHIVGKVTHSGNFYVTCGADKITFVGEGENAMLSISGDSLKLGCDVKFDHLTLASTASSTSIFGCFHNIEITDTVKTAGTWDVFAGHNVFADIARTNPASSGLYDTVEGVSCKEDCVITLESGTFRYVSGGNRRCAAQAPFGVYSGNMTLNIGGSATVTSAEYSGICGMNYLTGTITANIGAWGTVLLCDYAKAGTLSGIEFDNGRNTGTVLVNVAEGVEVNHAVTGDFNGDHTVDMTDALLLLRYVLDGFDVSKSANFYGLNKVDFVHVQRALRLLAS